jgi:hypothetical protein
MSRFKKLDEFERKFEQMDLNELRRWKSYWTYHAE